ncbi:MAG: hypothetical protein LBR16_07005 [Treponema sp.]|jgi:hypothetical protein|nr:hypothetical protein [Treponema sp.]
MTTNEKCERLHTLFNSMKRRYFTPDDIRSLGFTDGVYIVFEEGEKAHGADRIVRVGSHRKAGNLQKRLNQHRRDAGGSVFRRKVGCALLHKANPRDPDIVHWFQKDYHSFAPDALARVRSQVTGHITGKMSFVAFEVKDGSQLAWESRLIATIAKCDQCRQSAQWLGNSIPTNLGDLRKVKGSGLWLQNGVGDMPLTDAELAQLERMVKSGRGG